MEGCKPHLFGFHTPITFSNDQHEAVRSMAVQLTSIYTHEGFSLLILMHSFRLSVIIILQQHWLSTLAPFDKLILINLSNRPDILFSPDLARQTWSAVDAVFQSDTYLDSIQA